VSLKNKIVNYFKKLGAFSLGALVGVVYGSVIATLTCVAVLGLP